MTFKNASYPIVLQDRNTFGAFVRIGLLIFPVIPILLATVLILGSDFRKLDTLKDKISGLVSILIPALLLALVVFGLARMIIRAIRRARGLSLISLDENSLSYAMCEKGFDVKWGAIKSIEDVDRYDGIGGLVLGALRFFGVPGLQDDNGAIDEKVIEITMREPVSVANSGFANQSTQTTSIRFPMARFGDESLLDILRWHLDARASANSIR